MGALNVVASARWTGGVPDFNLFPIYMAVSVSHEDGTPAAGLNQAAFAVRIVQDPDRDVVAAQLSHFREHTSAGPAGSQGFYSFLLRPSEEGAETHLADDEVFLLVRIRGGGNNGQTLCYVRYRQR